MLPSIDLSHSSRPLPFTRWHVVNEWTVSKAAVAQRVLNVQLEVHLFLKEALNIRDPLIYI